MNSKHFQQSNNQQENVEEVLDFSIEENKVKFLIKWQNASLELSYYFTGSYFLTFTATTLTEYMDRI